MKLPTGKLDSDLLRRIVFDKIRYRNEDVKVRPGIGEDCAVIGFGDYDCVMSTDPISSAVEDIGRLCIHITCNDIASNGVRPLGIMLTVMLPEGTTEEDVERIMSQASETAAALEVEIVGGHTEITPAVRQPVIVSTAVGKTLQGASQSGNDMQAGDLIMITKSCGLEGAGIAANDHGDRLAGILTSEELERARSFLDMVSVVREGIAAGTVGTHGMHDITEGGILGAIWEMCQISGTGARIWEEEVPLEPETVKICDFFGLDPLRLISSGAMVIIVPADKKDEMISAMEDAEVDAKIIGEIVPADEGINLMRKAGSRGSEGEEMVKIKVDPPRMDEIYKIIERNS